MSTREHELDPAAGEEAANRAVVAGELLRTRPVRSRDPIAENLALRSLAAALADAPESVPDQVVQAALELTGAGSAGISRVEPRPEDGMLRWIATAGVYAPLAQQTFVRKGTPCDLALTEGATALITEPARFSCLAQLEPGAAEILIVPLHCGDEALGTLWVAAHAPEKPFDAEDERILSTLSKLLIAALSAAPRGAAGGELEALGSGQAILDTVLSSIVDFAYALDRGGRFVFVNQRLLDLWGLGLEQAVGKSFLDLGFPCELADRLQRQIQTVIETRSELSDEAPYAGPTGVAGYYEYRFAPVLGADGSVSMVAGSIRDITRRKRAEIELGETRRRLEASLMAGEIGAFEWDVTHDRLYGDSNFERLFDVALDATGAAPLASFVAAIHPEDRTRVVELLEQTVSTGCDHQAEYRILTNEREQWVIARAKAERDAEGRTVRLPGVVLDITAQKSAQRDRQALATEHERLSRVYDTILSATEDFAYVFDREARLLFANRRLLEVWDKTLDQVIGKTWHELGYPDWHARMHAREIREILATKRPIRGEVPFTGDSGISGVYDYIFTPVLGPDGVVEVIAGTTRDVTARKAAEEERERLLETLENERARLRAVIEQAPAFICTLGGPDHVFELANERYYEIVGEREIIGKPLKEALPELAEQGFIELLDKVYRTGETFTGNEIPALLRRQGDGALEQRTMNLVYQAPREADGSICGILGHGVDVTELVHARDALRANEIRLRRVAAEAEAASKAKDRFLAILSHELRTPLTPVALAAAEMETDARLSPDLREQVAMIRRNVDLETRLIDDLLDLSYVINGKLGLDRQPVHVHRMVHHVLEIVGAELFEQGVDVDVHLDAPVDRIDGDPARLQQTLWNLLTNVAKFTPRGGKASFRTSNEGDELVVEVADSGRGIPAELLSRVFDPFERGQAAKDRPHGGLGLGLAIAKAIVDLHGGSIRAASEGRDRGSTFTIRLPLATRTPARLPATGAPQPSSDPPGGLRLLLVEDHEDTATTLMRLLRTDGTDVRWAASIASALELASRERFDLIISDLGLPDGSGLDLLHRLDPRNPIPAIAMSGYGREEDLRRSRAAGFAEHLIKPVSVRALREAIRRVASDS